VSPGRGRAGARYGILWSVKARLTTLLAALLMAAAAFGLPVTRFSPERAAIYCIYGERHEARAEQSAEASGRPRFTPCLPDAALRERAAGPILDFARFQRPPPSSL